MEYEEIPYTGTTNPVYDYPKHVGRIRLYLNSIVCHICRVIPFIEIKNSLYRLIGVKIGKNVVVGVGATIVAHEYTQEKLRKGKVHIKKKALIGAGSLIRCGVTVGEHAVIGAKSFVNKDVPDFTIVAGVPAKIIKKKQKK
jgi:acetyltransferase-like isoleucine patch superfamily enzyme